ncbi:hypothetical protein [Nonomuraea cavernae]|uniref:Uncharacterized protein n=1 Tax=Nonomuraea cavernae TaxID=2045107 RepID=A0A918DUE1_9ACTN|nr:hypothetical protein [Nonomuraea cavernae]MCA2190993.1 hypothetical protein [Nonomuraea cavernae]GGO83666.1 hypothetical protein GCM10012289_77610 [Nonomuraea cavernae]
MAAYTAIARAERDFTARIAAPAEWSLPGFGIAATVLAFLEHDPDVVRDDERIRAVIRDVGGPVGRSRTRTALQHAVSTPPRRSAAPSGKDRRGTADQYTGLRPGQIITGADTRRYPSDLPQARQLIRSSHSYA